MIKNDNATVLNILGTYLNNYPNIIKEKNIKEITKIGVSTNKAFLLLFKNIFDIPDDLFDHYFPKIIKEEKIEDYQDNPYLKNVLVKPVAMNEWEIKYTPLPKYSGFVSNDFKCDFDGRIYPQIGYFTNDYSYLSIYQNDRLWMSITPNEINTMKEPINHAFGHVTTLGLGLGYFAYMVSLKDEVTKVDIVEIDENVIRLFLKYIYPFFPHPEKISIINMDALDYINMDFDSDYVFCDLWHDVSDGLPLYKKISHIASFHKDKIFEYWIYDTMKYYLKSGDE